MTSILRSISRYFRNLSYSVIRLLFAEPIDGILRSNSLLITLKENEQRLLKDNLELKKQIINLKESQEKQINNLKESQRKLTEETAKNLKSQLGDTNRSVKGLIAREGFYLRQLELMPEQIELLLETFEAEQLADLHQAYFTYPVLREKAPGDNLNSLRSNDERRQLFIQALTYSKVGPIFFLALPKSAGSWLTFVLQQVTGFLKANKRQIKSCPPLQNEPWNALYPYFTDLTELTDGVIEYYRQKPAIVHAHTAPTPNNVSQVVKHDIKYVFLYRDIRDVVVSLYYHMLQRRDGNQAFFEGISKEEGLDFIIERFLPGLAAFVDGWLPQRKNPNFLFISFEDLVSNPERVLKQVLRHYQFENCEGRIGDVLNTYRFRPTNQESSLIHSSFKWRQGTPGEWRNHFSKKQKEDIKKVAGTLLVSQKYEPDIDW